jgi:hypothetical protein
MTPPVVNTTGKPNLELLVQGSIHDCPPCPTDPWVVLAKVSFDESGIINLIDNCECRRLVISFGSFWWKCASEPCDTQATEKQPAAGHDRPESAEERIARIKEQMSREPKGLAPAPEAPVNKPRQPKTKKRRRKLPK